MKEVQRSSPFLEILHIGHLSSPLMKAVKVLDAHLWISLKTTEHFHLLHAAAPAAQPPCLGTVTLVQRWLVISKTKSHSHSYFGNKKLF